MTDSTTKPPPTTLDKTRSALADLGQASAAKIGETIGIAYSTTTPKLRELEGLGQAERIRTSEGTTLWQLTAAGVAEASDDAADPTPEPTPASGDSGDPIQEQPNRTDPDQQRASDTDAPEPDQPDKDALAADTSDQVPTPDPDGPESDQPDNEPPAATTGVGDQGPVSVSPVSGHATAPPATVETSASGGQTSTRRDPLQPRRRKGELRDAVLALLQQHPDTGYKVGEICKLLNQATAGTPVNKASAGAVANALDKLVIGGTVRQLDATVATYQAV